MKCGFCAREIPDEPDRSRDACGACPGGCRKVHCPYCGYANPVIPRFLRRLGRQDESKDPREE